MKYPDTIFHTHKYAKEEICRALRRAVDEEREPQRKVAARLRTSQANISRATRYPTAEKLSYDQLFRYLAQLRPRFKILISI